MGMDAPATREHRYTSGGVGLVFIRMLLAIAWVFNFVVLVATVMEAWKSENPGTLLGVGFVVLWLLSLGVVTWRTCGNTQEAV
jgi:hypothetical protein